MIIGCIGKACKLGKNMVSKREPGKKNRTLNRDVEKEFSKGWITDLAFLSALVFLVARKPLLIFNWQKYALTGTILCLLSITGFAQEGLEKDEAFFRQQVPVFQKWLDMNGLGEVLNVRDVVVSPNEVDLFLEIPGPYTHPDSLADYVFLNWIELRHTFRQKNAINLETQLFLKMLHIMELEREQAFVHLYDTYETSRQEKVGYRISFQNEQITTDSLPFRPKATFHSVKILSSRQAGIAQSEIEIKREFLKGNDQLFDRIYSFFRQVRFQNNTIQPIEKIRDLEQGLYTISVKPIYKEVLKDQENQLICQWLNRLGFSDCNTLKKEWLTFTFKVTPNEFGFQLDCTLEGKCSERRNLLSARGSFKEIDHDPASKEILQDYGDLFLGDLRRFLTKD